MKHYHHARCLCGLRLALHRDEHNRSLRCAEARARHPRASKQQTALRSLLLAVKRAA